MGSCKVIIEADPKVGSHLLLLAQLLSPDHGDMTDLSELPGFAELPNMIEEWLASLYLRLCERDYASAWPKDAKTGALLVTLANYNLIDEEAPLPLLQAFRECLVPIPVSEALLEKRKDELWRWLERTGFVYPGMKNEQDLKKRIATLVEANIAADLNDVMRCAVAWDLLTPDTPNKAVLRWHRWLQGQGDETRALYRSQAMADVLHKIGLESKIG
jgi:hypothetical protein